MPPAATSSKVAVGGGHKVTTVADGALASAAPPAEPDGAACVLPHRIPVDRLCVSRRSPPVAYSTGADGRVCCSGLGGNARASFGERGVVAVESWQFDLALLEPPGTSRGWLCGGGALAGTAVGCVKVWDAGDGRLERSMTGHAGPVRSLAVADPSGVLASGGDDGTCRIWDLAREGACVACSPAAPDGLRVARRAARDVFVVGDAAGAARAWDARKPGAFASETGAAVPGGVVGLAADGDHWYTLGRCFQDWGDPARARGLPKASEVAKWDPRKLAAPSETVGFHQDVGVTLELCDAGLLSASRDGGVALWGTGGGLAGELRCAPGRWTTAVSVPGGDQAYCVGSDRVLRVWDLAAGATSTRPCCECGGAGRQDLPSGSSCVCVACRGTGRSPVDAGFAPDDDENGDNDAETERPRGDGGAAAAAPPKPRPSITRAPSWLAKHAKQPDDKTLPATLPTVARVRASRPFAANFSDRRFEPGDLVVLRNSLPEYKDAAPALVKRQGANEPAIRGNEVGEILNDDLSRVPYEVRGPRGGAPSWFEAVQLAVCPPERAPAGKVALAKARGAAKTPVPPTPPAKKAPSPTPADDDDADAFGAMFDFRAAPAAEPAQPPAKPAVTDAERRAQRDAQRAADRNVDDSMAQYMAQKAAHASAAGGGSRRPASDRLRKLRGEA
ncbi:hypothetical protein AURANDRAFT_63422 [Aureococcus anophagefferens]|uniref:Uncharacterized protein n=1 Tax=Aureococcus anophagefferens TaxID=44056 RepID=F0Y6W4_AURAN|nr:hypothetical protein AURANDRAFT_63422 [Aureococcus anophagefferens]EGB09298.1 hypothetical protein AURANDRAFT_63422 [Aureococcus anophagefferens]|eukprot:XP_009036398.1 hypothetical protein AURANDRAFT_63422 [Aureococcus anophagefferens]